MTMKGIHSGNLASFILLLLFFRKTGQSQLTTNTRELTNFAVHNIFWSHLQALQKTHQRV